jgi:tellurite resistance protein
VKLSADIKPLVDAFCARFGADDEGIVTAVDLAVLVAVADGTIDADERAALAASMEVIMGATVAPTVVRYLIRESRNQIQAAGADARARAIGGILAARNATDEGLRLALAIAFASGGLAQSERDAITHVAKAAGATDARLEALIKSAASRAQEPAPET